MRSSMVISALNFILPVSLCSDFYIKKCRANFQHELRLCKKFCSGVSKIADFRHVDMEGQVKGALPVWRQHPLKTMLNAVSQQKFSKSVSTLPQFLHRGTAGNLEPLTRGGAGRIRMGDRWLLILERSNFKNFRKRFPKGPILDIRWWLTCWKNFLEGVSLCLDFYIEG